MESHPLIYIRTDGGAQIATGHFVRTLAIARACVLLHADVHYLVSSRESAALLRTFFEVPEEYPITVLASDDAKQELPLLTSYLTTNKGDLLLIDTYRATASYLERLRPLIKTCYLDDLQAFVCPVDILVNYDISVTYDPTWYVHTKLLTGAAYTPLRGQFADTAYEVRDPALHLLLSTGGTDPLNLAFTLSAGLHEQCPGLLIHVLLGKLNTHKDALLRLAEASPWLILHENVTDMVNLLSSCDLAVSAGGTTLYELCAVGVPSVSYSFADNQIPGASAFSDTGVIPYAGDARDGDLLPALTGYLTAYRDSKKARTAASARMRREIDGNGAKRIAAALLAAAVDETL